MTTIVFCHPSDDSFNHAVLDAISSNLEDLGREYAVINLYGEHFNPVLESSAVEHSDPQAEKYARLLAKTSKIIFIFPIWWGEMPAMLKGFIDKSFIKGIVYDTTPEGAMMPCLDINSAMVVTTSEADSELFGNYIMGYLDPITFSTVGIHHTTWYNLDHISRRTDAERQNFITELLREL